MHTLLTDFPDSDSSGNHPRNRKPLEPRPCLLGCFLSLLRFRNHLHAPRGGADMPITISLLNSLSGVAAAISGLAVADVLLVSVGAIVGASGLLLTQIMCRAMNRKLLDILLEDDRFPNRRKEIKEKIPKDPLKWLKAQERHHRPRLRNGGRQASIW